MSFLNKIKLKYTSDLLNQSIEKKDFSDFKKNYEDLKKMDQGLANKYIKYNSFEFIENEELNFLFNKNNKLLLNKSPYLSFRNLFNFLRARAR